MSGAPGIAKISQTVSVKLPCKHVKRILFFILDKLLCSVICFILFTKQLVLCGWHLQENLHTGKLAGAQRVTCKRNWTVLTRQCTFAVLDSLYIR